MYRGNCMSKMNTIFITEPNEISQSAIDLLTRAGYDVATNLKGCDLATICGLFIRTYTQVDKDYLEQFPNIQFVLRAGVGLDNIDLTECSRRNIQVFNSPGANSDAVAEYVLTMSLYAIRGIGPQITKVKDGEWRSVEHVGRSLGSLTFGLVGCGHAGRALATKLQSLGVACLGYDPYVTVDILAPLGVTKVELVDLLARADVVVIMLPLTKETISIMDAEKLSLMKIGSTLINVSRGEMIDETALINELKSGRLHTAILDVMVSEPTVNPDLLNTPNIIITPHIAGYTIQANESIAVMAVQNLLTRRLQK
jgi:phosphoglycerate dehydrogenase-like enzyme